MMGSTRGGETCHWQHGPTCDRMTERDFFLISSKIIQICLMLKFQCHGCFTSEKSLLRVGWEMLTLRQYVTCTRALGTHNPGQRRESLEYDRSHLPPLRLGGPQSGLTAHRNTKMRVSQVFKTQINVIYTWLFDKNI